MSDVDDDAVEDDSIATRRSRRSRGDKGGRLAALEKLKNTRKGGVKNKYEVKDLENVYDVVDEDTYSKKVNDRLKDDWIVDDGTGYCETGHELFDDDLIDDDGYAGSSKRKNKAPNKSKKPTKEERQNQKSNFLSVRDMLTNMPAKRKRDTEENSAAAGGADELLGDMLMELNEEKTAKKVKPDERQGVKLLSVLTNMPMKRRRDGTDAESSFSSEANHSLEDILQHVEKRAKPSSSLAKFSKNNKSEPSGYQEITEYSYGTEMESDGFVPVEPSLDTVKVKIEKEDIEETSVATTLFRDNAIVKIEPAAKEEKPKHTLTTTMHDIIENAKAPATTTTSQIESNVECMTIDETGNKQVLNFYWFDIYEEPRNPGVLYLFGKVSQEGAAKGFVSCCIAIQNVQRCVYILPRLKMRDNPEKDVTFPDVSEEIEERFKKLHILQFRARKVEKKYCFSEENVPKISEYMEIFYPGTSAALPEDFQGNTFSRAFGTRSSMLENFLLKNKLKGPCWLQIVSPVKVELGQQQSWCKMEFNCDVGGVKIHPQKDSIEIPPFVVASINLSSVNDPKTKKDCIISASVVVNRVFKMQSALTTEGLFHDSFCLLNRPPGEIWPFDVDRILSKFTTKMDSERSMLACLLAKLSQFDPDIYVGHDLNLDLLLLQLWNHKVPHWSRIGRLKRSSQPQKGGKLPDSRSAVAGRLVCDVQISAKELIRARSYDLPSLASQVLGLNEDQITAYTGAELRSLFESSDGIQHLAAWGMSLSILNLRLMNELQVMPLALQITTIAGNTLARTLMGGRSERNEFLLLHAFYNKEYIVPDKQYKKKFKREDDEEGGGGEDKKNGGKSSGPAYVGGLVLEPKKGFYDNFIVLMDFLSLYPSIIQEFNICFTTTTTENHTDYTEKGILPEEIRKLVESRREVKKLMQAENISHDLKRQYDIRQKALKLTANSMYGCLGFGHSRFYAKNLAALITGKGREILMNTKVAVEGLGFEVIYGDTDSLMINTNTQEIEAVYKIGNKIRTEINRMYRLLELEIDGVFRFLLLLKKKKYAALTYSVKKNGQVETAMELKGLDIVRRDWAPVAATTARAILDEIMSEQALDDKIFKIVKILNDKAEELKAGQVPLKDLLITKQLAKNPEDYKDRQGLYHVTVAKRLNQTGKLPKKFKNGDTVPYVFCTDGIAHHPVELLENKATPKVENNNENGGDASIKHESTVLEPDAKYYLAQQLHPVVSRICEPIPGLDAARIAESLGMDPSSYKRRHVVDRSQDDIGLGEITEAEKYRDCARFKFPCVKDSCRHENVIEAPFLEIRPNEWISSLNKMCPGCSSISPISYMAHVLNSLVLFMRKFIEKYYQGWFVCEDPACPNRVRGVNLSRLERGYMVCPCKQGVMIREYTEADLYKQLSYLLYVFDVKKHKEALPMIGKSISNAEIIFAEKQFEKLSTLVQNQLNQSAYSEIRLEDLFMDLLPKFKHLFHDKKGKKQNPPTTSEIPPKSSKRTK